MEWAIVDHRDADDRFLAVPADLDPLLGSTDVATAADTASGCLTVRCGIEVPIEASVLAAAKRTGFLEDGDLDRVRRKRAEIAAGTLVASTLERETEAEPAYEILRKELEHARAALLASWRPQASTAGPSTPERRRSGRAIAFLQASSWRPFSSLYGIAAMLLLVLTSALGGALAWQNRGAEAYVNVPLVYFPPVGPLRGEARKLNVAPTANRIHIVIGVKGSHPVYRLDIGRQGRETPVWTGDELTGANELSIDLPRNLFPDGEYALRLFGLREGRGELLEEYLLLVNTE